MGELPFKHQSKVTNNAAAKTDVSIIQNLVDSINVRREIDKFGMVQTTVVSNFDTNDAIDVSLNYSSENSQSIAKFNLNIKTLDDVSFKFILSIKNGRGDMNPVLYTSKSYYDELVNSYSDGNPYKVIGAINSSAVVVIDCNDFVEKVEQLKVKEFDAAKTGVVVSNHVFIESQHSLDDNALPPDYDYSINFNYDDLVRYIDHVVSKPSSNASERVLNASEIGEWISVSDI